MNFFDPMLYINKHKSAVPTVFLLGKEIFSSPAASVASESMCSDGRQVCHYPRSRLLPENVSMLTMISGNAKFFKEFPNELRIQTAHAKQREEDEKKLNEKKENEKNMEIARKEREKKLELAREEKREKSRMAEQEEQEKSIEIVTDNEDSQSKKKRKNKKHKRKKDKSMKGEKNKDNIFQQLLKRKKSRSSNEDDEESHETISKKKKTVKANTSEKTDTGDIIRRNDLRELCSLMAPQNNLVFSLSHNNISSSPLSTSISSFVPKNTKEQQKSYANLSQDSFSSLSPNNSSSTLTPHFDEYDCEKTPSSSSYSSHCSSEQAPSFSSFSSAHYYPHSLTRVPIVVRGFNIEFDGDLKPSKKIEVENWDLQYGTIILRAVDGTWQIGYVTKKSSKDVYNSKGSKRGTVPWISNLSILFTIFVVIYYIYV